MAAGSIVGASRGAIGNGQNASSSASNHTARSGGGGRSHNGPGNQGGHKSARREPRSSTNGQARPEQHCRASLVPQFESAACVPEACLSSPAVEEPSVVGDQRLLRLMGLDKQPMPGTAMRPVWLVCTANALTVYEGASRRARLATFSTRKLYAVIEAAPRPAVTRAAAIGPPAMGGLTEGGDCGAAAGELFGILAGFHPDLPATVRPPPRPLAESDTRRLGFACLYFSSITLQQRWLGVLRQASDPKPRLAASPAMGGVGTGIVGTGIVGTGVVGTGIVGTGIVGTGGFVPPQPPLTPLAISQAISQAMGRGGPPVVMPSLVVPLVPPASGGLSGPFAGPLSAPLAGPLSGPLAGPLAGVAGAPRVPPVAGPPLCASQQCASVALGMGLFPSAAASSALPLNGVVGGYGAMDHLVSSVVAPRCLAPSVAPPVAMSLPLPPAASDPLGVAHVVGRLSSVAIRHAGALGGSHDVLPSVSAVVPVVSLLPVDAAGVAGGPILDDDDPLIPAIEAVAIETVAAVVAD